MPSVAIVQRVVPHYRAAFFERLRAELADEGIELMLVHSSEDLGGDHAPPWATSCHARAVTAAGRSLVWQRLPAEVARSDLTVIEFALGLPSNYALIARAQRVAAWGHGRNFQSARLPSRAGPYAALARRMHWWFAYTDLSRRALHALGVDDERITCVRNTLDVEGLQQAARALAPERTARLRERLGLDEGPVGIFCGTLHSHKRLPFLFEAAARIRSELPGFALIVVGDGPERDAARAFAARHDWVHLAGAATGSDRVPWFQLADVSLMPGLVGLGVLDSFALGVPLVTTDWPFHSPEIDYLEHGRNGWMTPDDVGSYADAVVRLLRDPDELARLREGCAAAASQLTLGRMVGNFRSGIRAALAA